MRKWNTGYVAAGGPTKICAIHCLYLSYLDQAIYPQMVGHAYNPYLFMQGKKGVLQGEVMAFQGQDSSRLVSHGAVSKFLRTVGWFPKSENLTIHLACQLGRTDPSIFLLGICIYSQTKGIPTDKIINLHLVNKNPAARIKFSFPWLKNGGFSNICVRLDHFKVPF